MKTFSDIGSTNFQNEIDKAGMGFYIGMFCVTEFFDILI